MGRLKIDTAKGSYNFYHLLDFLAEVKKQGSQGLGVFPQFSQQIYNIYEKAFSHQKTFCGIPWLHKKLSILYIFIFTVV